MQFLALAARGTAELVAAECRALSLKVTKTDAEGVHLDLSWRELAIALVHLRVAQRILVELGSHPAFDGDSLYAAARKVDWGEWLDARSTFAVYASGDTMPPGKTPEGRPHAGLTNLQFVGLRVKDAIADDLTRRLGKRPNVSRDDPVVSVVVRGRQGRWNFYLDAADPPLFQRGIRIADVEAPLKETLAAACVDLTGWTGRGKLIDPMCGSGTLIIEAVSKVLGLAPGCTRTFAIERWPHHGKTLLKWCTEIRAQAVEKAQKALEGAKLDVAASDIDPAAVRATRENLANAGLSELVQVSCRDARELPPQPPGTVLLSNPPYGQRLSPGEAEPLWRELGQAWRGKGLWQVWLIAPNELPEAMGWERRRTSPLNNGSIDVAMQLLVEPSA